MKKTKETTPTTEHEALVKLRKEYGNDVLFMGDGEQIKIDSIPTGCFSFDYVLGCGGLPRGRIMELYGEPSSGKTATTLFLISQIQKSGGTCAFIDAEYAFNHEFATSIGVDVKKLLIAQPNTLEEAMDTVRALVSANAVDLIVLDSVAALVPKREVEGEEMLKSDMAVQAQLMSKALRILTGEIARSKSCVIMINHLKEKMGMVWGDKQTTPGGKSLKFFSSVRIAVSKGDKIKGEKDEQIGAIVKITAQKNKVAPPWRKGEFSLIYKTGVDLYADTFDWALELGILTKTGNSYSFGEVKLGVGRDQGIAALKADEKAYKAVRKEVEAKIK